MNPAPVETRLAGTARSRFLLEFFANSAHFPIANVILEMLLEGPAKYLRAPDLYTILLASLVQAYWLSRWETTPRPRRFLGNLIGPALYTVIEALIEGPGFFARPQHWAYWGFALVLGALQALRPRLAGAPAALAHILEGGVRTSILLATYAIFEMLSNPHQTTSLGAFFTDPSHQFVALVIPLLGLSVGLADLTAGRYLRLLRETSAQLKMYSEWLLGRDLLNQIVADPGALTLARRVRTVLFMDVRGFTRWSESRPPETVVALLNRYYLAAETALNRHGAIKFKYSADEVMAIFATAAAAVAAARDLRASAAGLLAPEQLGAGMGLHTGPLVEGLLGSAGVKFYDVIGDTVNTAKRLEGAAAGGEVLLSEAARAAHGGELACGPARQIAAKGKDAPLTVFPLA
jgi:class 3 adenylate cyclase